MTAYVVGQIRVRDPAKWQEYISQVAATVLAHRGHIEFRGEVSEVFSGDFPFDRVVVLRFADVEAAQAWHTSDAYQRLVPLRAAAADVTLVCFEDGS